ncbi:MAG: 16S rRNA (cytosine(1402)-N(4))-methyltransferase RsmH [Patescibacteria group bacterium]
MPHVPVLLNEILEHFDPKPGQKFIDATIDGGGHARAIAERIEPDGRLLGIEWDGELFDNLRKEIQNTKFKNIIKLINDSYVNLKKNAEENDFMEADGVLFDLGMSSWHPEVSGRGFSFQRDEDLDMRYHAGKFPISPDSQSESRILDFASQNRDNFQFPNKTAKEIVNKYSYDHLVEILKEYGEERFAKSIAANIVRARKTKLIETTFELVEIIKNSVPFWYKRGRLHCATKTFQALRISVNNELANIETGLEQSLEVLKSGGRLAVISFHSLEDRIVKNFFRNKKQEKIIEIINKKPITANPIEIRENPRARSAKLRIVQKIVFKSKYRDEK